MSTAIISKQFGNAFVVGSDGLATHLDGRKPNPNTRKIFDLCHPRSTIVYAVMGNPEITNDATGEMVVSFPKDIARMADSQWGASDFMEFVRRICLPLNSALRSAREADEILDYPSKQDIVRVLFAGYFNGHPCQIEARFFHLDQVLQEPEFRMDNDYHYGSNAVRDKIALGCQGFKEYQPIAGFMNLESTVENMKRRITAYGCPKAKEIDAVCRSIGGMTQICIVRPDGIEWRYGPATGYESG